MATAKTKSKVPAPDNETRRRILAGGRRHFFAHGFRGVTMEEIARELGMSKKTLYAHFASKEELIEGAIGEKLSCLDADLGEIEQKNAGDFEATLRGFLACMQRHAGEIAPPFVRDMKGAAPQLWRSVEERRGEIIERYFGKLFREGRGSGLIRADLPPELIVEVMLGLIQVILNPQKVTELNLTPQTALTQALSIVLKGIFVSNKASQQ